MQVVDTKAGTAGQAGCRRRQGRPKKQRHRSVRIMNRTRLIELALFAEWCSRLGVVIDPVRWLAVVVHALFGGYGRLDLAFVRLQLRRRGLTLDVSDDEIVLAIHAVENSTDHRHAYMAPRQAGALIQLTKDARRELGIATLAAIDETDVERRQYQADREREADRERKRRERMAAGSMPRELSNEAVRPWDAAGVSRRTWYRRAAAEKRGTNSSGCNLLYEEDRTKQCHTVFVPEVGAAASAPEARASRRWAS